MKFDNTVEDSFHEKAYFQILKLSSFIEQRVKSALKPLGLTHHQLNVLSILEESKPKPIPLVKINSKIKVVNPDTTRLLDRMEKKNWIKREDDPNNKRRKMVSITDLGSDVYFRGHILAKNSVENYFSNTLNPLEAAYLYDMIKKKLMQTL